jgi:hypothetical protein
MLIIKIIFVLFSILIAAHANAQTHILVQGWNLEGNDNGATIDPNAIFGNATTPTTVSPNVTTVWAWDKTASIWNFFAPSMTPSALSAYAATKGYGVLTTISQGQGFWINANSAVSVNLTAPLASTAVIQVNMQINYQNESSSVSLAVRQCAAQYGSSGATTTCSASAKQGAVQNYLNVLLANIQALKSSTPIDKIALAAIFQTYQAQDIAWLSVSAIGPTTNTSLINAVSGSYYSSVNTSYSNALIQLAGM